MAKKKRGWFKNGGEAHRGWYKGFWCDSSWELALILYCQDNGVEIVRNTKNFPYMWRNRTEYYRPDFIMDGKYVEIKGYMDRRSKRKIGSFVQQLEVIDAKAIKPYLQWAVSHYGENFYDLLEKS